MEIELKKLKREYIELVREWRNSPNVNKFMYSDHEITSSEHETWFNRIHNDASKIYWLILIDKTPIGVVNLYDIDHHHKRCGIAHYIASKEMRGKGIGTIIEHNLYAFVFDKLKLNKITFEVLDFNTAAIKLHENCGSKLEARLRQHIFKNNRYYDVLLFTLLRREWEEFKKDKVIPKITIDF